MQVIGRWEPSEEPDPRRAIAAIRVEEVTEVPAPESPYE